MKTLLPMSLAAFLTACSSGRDDGFSLPPETHFTLATTGDLSMAYRFEEVSPSTGWSGDPADCTNVSRGIFASSDDNAVQIDFDLDGCTQISEGAPPAVLPGSLRVNHVGFEDYNSAYYDGAARVEVDGCLVTVSEVVRWEESPWYDDHLFIGGTYVCQPLFTGSDQDTSLIASPGTFFFDWTGSQVD